MNQQDRQAIDGVFARLQEVERQGLARDAEAEAFIQERMQAQPGAPYYLAQTVVVQEQALAAAQQRIAELEKSARPAAPLDAMGFGRSAGAGGTPAGTGQAARPGPGGGFGRTAGQSGGSGFLAGAMQTALGVAGGMMLGSLLGGLFGGNEAQAAEAAPQDGAADPDAAGAQDGDAGSDMGGMGDMGDMGDMGGFDDI